jgi:hypothetical protein
VYAYVYICMCMCTCVCVCVCVCECVCVCVSRTCTQGKGVRHTVYTAYAALSMLSAHLIFFSW